MYSATLGGTRYGFPDLKTLLAKASPKRSGDALAGDGREPRGPSCAISWARATVTALRARTRTPFSSATPSSVARSTTRNTARLASQNSMKPSLRVRAVSQLSSSDQSPCTRPARSSAAATISSASTRIAASTFSKYW